MTTYSYLLRRDTAAVWAAANPVLADGEQGLETDTLRLKIGNGTAAYADLPYTINLTTWWRARVAADPIAAIQALIVAADVAAAQTALGVSGYAQTLLDDADAAAAQTTLGVSAYAQTLLDDADASAAQTTLGISTFIKTLIDDADAGAAQTTLGISTFIKTLLDDADAGAAQTTLGISAYVKTLLDDADAATARATLGGTADGQALFTAATAAAQADLLLPARDWRGRNVVINGNFDLWQRGTSLSAGAGAYLADRWASVGSGSTVAPSRQTFTLGQTDVPGEPVYFHRIVVASVANAANYALLYQKVEGVRTLAGQTITLSFWAKADAAKPMSIELYQDFGTGGSPSATVSFGLTKVNLTTSWQRFTVTAAAPSISGKTLGSDGNDALVVRLWFDSGANTSTPSSTLGQQSGTFDIAQVQLEPGAVATTFERLPLGVVRTLCQRYYFKTFPAATDPAQNAGTTGAYGFGQGVAGAASVQYPTCPFHVHMRAAPTVTTYNPSAANAQPRNTTAGADFSGITVQTVPWGWFFTATGPAGGSAGHASFVHITANAEL